MEAPKPQAEKTRRFIKARWSDGFRLCDFEKVIRVKSQKWKSDPKMADFLRPETLFGTKFEGYLNEKVVENKPDEKEYFTGYDD